jgi:two-component system nitrogen regulation response regulator NtrX
LGGNARIIIIDDDESIRKILSTILQEEGYTVDTADTGKEGIRKTNENCYNLALIDMKLPDIEGIDLLLRIKDTTPRMRKMIITGFPTIHNAMEAVNRRADAFILKPFEMEKVLQTIREQLKKQEEEQKFSQDKVAAFIETRAKELEMQES